MTTLSTVQRAALAMMARDNIGAVRVGTIYGIVHGGRFDSYAFPVDVREGSPTATGDDIALCVLAALTGDPRDMDATTLPVACVEGLLFRA